MLDETLLNKLALSKYLLIKGNQEALKPEPMSSVSILHYHDSLEILFLTVLEHNLIKKNNKSFIEYFNLINSHFKEKGNENIEEYELGLKKLKDNRVRIKHKAEVISKTQINELKFVARSIFEKICQIEFNLNFNNVSLIQYIENPKIKDLLNKAMISFESNKIESAENLILAFELLLKGYEEIKLDIYNKSPFYFGKDLSHFNMSEIGDSTVDIFIKFMNESGEAISYIQKAMKIVSFGLDYKKFIKFQLMLPKVLFFKDRSYEFFHSSYLITEEDLYFCIDFVFESYLILNNSGYGINNFKELNNGK